MEKPKKAVSGEGSATDAAAMSDLDGWVLLSASGEPGRVVATVVAPDNQRRCELLESGESGGSARKRLSVLYDAEIGRLRVLFVEGSARRLPWRSRVFGWA